MKALLVCFKKIEEHEFLRRGVAREERREAADVDREFGISPFGHARTPPFEMKRERTTVPFEAVVFDPKRDPPFVVAPIAARFEQGSEARRADGTV